MEKNMDNDIEAGILLYFIGWVLSGARRTLKYILRI